METWPRRAQSRLRHRLNGESQYDCAKKSLLNIRDLADEANWLSEHHYAGSPDVGLDFH